MLTSHQPSVATTCALVGAGESRRRGRSSALGSVDHRRCRRSQPHADVLDGQRPAPLLAVQAAGRRLQSPARPPSATGAAQWRPRGRTIRPSLTPAVRGSKFHGLQAEGRLTSAWVFAAALLNDATLTVPARGSYATSVSDLRRARRLRHPAPAASAREHRSAAVKHEFQLAHPCPATGLTRGRCPGYVKDHIVPLACGGPDAVSNMQWQTTRESYRRAAPVTTKSNLSATALGTDEPLAPIED